MLGIALIGLRPGDPDQLTREAWDMLSSADEILLCTDQHPTSNRISSGVELHSFGDARKSHRSQRGRAGTG